MVNTTNQNQEHLGMMCEYGNCKSHKGEDYIRPKEMSTIGWEDEPVFLCEVHAKEMKAQPVS